MRCALAVVWLLASAHVAFAQSATSSTRASTPRDSDPVPTVPVAANGGIPLVNADTVAWRYQLVTAPALATQIGALATSGLDVVAGRAQRPIEVLGEPTTAPPAWPYDVDN